MIGQLITSFLQGKVNLTTTSTIFSPYVDRVMEESKTGFFKESHGATLSSNRGRGHKGGGIPGPSNKRGWGIKTVGVASLRALNDLLPYDFRPIKAKRRRGYNRWGWGVELYTWRMTWLSHRKPALLKKIRQLQMKMEK